MKKSILIICFFILVSCWDNSTNDKDIPSWVNSWNLVFHENNSLINDSIYVDNIYLVKWLENVNQLSPDLIGNNTLTLYKGKEGIDREYLYIEEKQWQTFNNETIATNGMEVKFKGNIKLLVWEIDNYHYIAENIEELSVITE